MPSLFSLTNPQRVPYEYSLNAFAARHLVLKTCYVHYLDRLKKPP